MLEVDFKFNSTPQKQLIR